MTFIKSFLARRLPVPSGWLGTKSEFEAAGESGDVYWIPEHMMNAPGKTTVFNNIRLNEYIRQTFPHEVVEYIFLHERGHVDREWLSRVIFLSTAIMSFLLSILSFLFSIILVGLAMADLTMTSVVTAFFSFGIPVFFGWIFCRVQRKEELRAEHYALNRLGEEEFRQRHEMWEKQVNRGVFSHLQRKLLYPNIETVISTHGESS